MVPSLFGLPLSHMISSKSPPNLYVPPNPISMTHMIRQQRSPVLLDPPGKPDQQSIHCPTANLGPLSMDNVTNPMLITVFDTYFTPRSPGAWI